MEHTWFPRHGAGGPAQLDTRLEAVAAGAEALGCPNCKDAVNTSDPDGLNIARGYFYSILLMLAMPFTLVSSFGAYVWREMRRQKAAAAVGETQEHSAP